jgi:hypothetical protein
MPGSMYALLSEQGIHCTFLSIDSAPGIFYLSIIDFLLFMDILYKIDICER